MLRPFSPSEDPLSRPWKRELRLELRPNACYAVLHDVGLQRRVLASASAAGRGAAALRAAIAALRRADSDWLTLDARLTVADEYVRFMLLPGALDPREAERLARRRFIRSGVHRDLLVHTVELPGQRSRLAAAITLADFDAWTDALLMAGVTLQHIHPALTEDLRALAPRIAEPDAVLVLLREEGATLVRIEDGMPVALKWEHMVFQHRALFDARLQRFARASGGHDGPVVVYMLPASKALCRYVLDPAPGTPRLDAGVAGLTCEPAQRHHVGIPGLWRVPAYLPPWQRTFDPAGLPA
jgi:hypothetical protein